MFQSLVERLLAQIMGEYIENFSKENLKIGIWSGQVVLRDLIIKRDIMKKFNLPLLIKFSRIGLVKLNIPWKSLTSSKIQVLLEGLQIVIAQVPQSKWNCKDTKIIQKRKQEIQRYCQSIINDFAKKAEKPKGEDEGYFSQLIVRIIDNLQVTVKDIHVRFEDDITNEYSFGVTLEELKMYTVNAQGKPEYIDRTKKQYANEPLRKRLELYNIGIYWNQKSQFYNKDNYSARLQQSIAKRGQQKHEHNYIILLTSDASLKQRDPGKQFDEPQIDLGVNLSTLRIQISNNQLQQIITLGERLQKYNSEVKKKNTKILPPQTKQKNKKQFMQVFPEFYKDFKNNTDKMPEKDVQKLEDIIEVMEVQNFMPEIKTYLQVKEKERIIEEKKKNSKGWFGWGSKPKELTEDQMKQIENYLDDNFGKDFGVVKRPKQYYYIKVLFRLQKLQLIVANTLSVLRQGIKSQLDELKVIFQLREGGYKCNLGVGDVSVDMFKKSGVEAEQKTAILYKIVPDSQKNVDDEYVTLEVLGNPLERPHLNTDIKLRTSELMVVFYPKLINIATNFADLKFSQENKDAAYEKYGQIKQITTATVTQSIEQPVKQYLGADIFINSITVAVPLDPKRPHNGCWGLTLGSLHFLTDEQTTKRTSVPPGEPMDVYRIKMQAFSFRHYKDIKQLEALRKKTIKSVDPRQAILNNLDFEISLSIYGQNTQKLPKIKVDALLPDFSVTLNRNLYKNILQLGDCFSIEQEGAERISTRKTEKADIKEKAVKIGMVYIYDNVTHVYKKYVAIMAGNYVYLYNNPKDEKYSAYYYIKNAHLQTKRVESDKQKPYHFTIKNKINQVTFGFDKPELIDDWVIKIKQVAKKEEENTSEIVVQEKKPEKKEVHHNLLTLMVSAKIQKINVKVYLTDSLEKEVINFEIGGLGTEVYLHQSRKMIKMQLTHLELTDCLKQYKCPSLKYFLSTQHTKKNKRLIKIDILQFDQIHPDYDNVSSFIEVDFGTLTCNYKCETVKALMAFFIPKKPEGQKEQIKQQEQAKDSTQTTVLDSVISISNVEVYTMKLSLKISDISVNLVNQKSKTLIGKLGITNLTLFNGMSNKRMHLLGSLKQLYFLDYSGYPKTITEEKEDYEPFGRYIMKANVEGDKNMLEFDITMLNQLNEDKKKMLIKTQLNYLTVYYTQQPVLRLITYLNTQMLPSFDTGDAKDNKASPEDAKQRNPDAMVEMKPEPSPMDLKVDLTNLGVYIEPDPWKQQKEYLQLNIEKVEVRNEVKQRDYIEDSRDKVWVEIYKVKVLGLAIYTRYLDIKGRKHEYELTNKMDIDNSIEMITNPQYYIKKYKDKFLNGMRINCSTSPFLMRINQRDYSFIMKCLNWSITHNDGCDDLLYDVKQEKAAGDVHEDSKKKEADPMYIDLFIDCLSLLIMNRGVPLAYLVLDDLKYKLAMKSDMNMELTLPTIFGTAIEHNKQYGVLIERGMFNAVGYEREHSFKGKKNMEQFKKMFYEERQNHLNENTDKQIFMQFTMTMTQNISFMSCIISEIIMDMDIKVLMELAGIAGADPDYIKGPDPVRNVGPKPTKDKLEYQKMKEQELKHMTSEQVDAHPAELEVKHQKSMDEGDMREKQMEIIRKKMMITLNLHKIVGSISDKKKEKMVIMEGQIDFTMTNHGERGLEELNEHFKNPTEKLNQSEMGVNLNNLSLYFCKIQNQQFTSKREILKPHNISCQVKTYYEKKEKTFILTTDMCVKTQPIIFFASILDLLNFDIIMKDNMKALQQSQKKQQQDEKKKKDEKKEQQAKNEQKIHEIQKKASKAIQTQMKIRGDIEPIQFELVNDFNNNFMPVLRFMIQDISPLVDQYLIKNHTLVSFMISLYFFNPRSSQWEPIIEPFKSTVDYLILTTPDGPNVKFLMESHKISEDQNEVGALKLNISTQMLQTLMAAKDLATRERQKMTNDVTGILDFMMNQGKDKKKQTNDVEVSPFIFENVTNEIIQLQRGGKDRKQFQMDPLYKGPVKLENDKNISFRLKGKEYTYGMDHYGTLKITGTVYLIQFDIQKLSRVIRFLSVSMLHNKLFQSIYVRRYGTNVKDVPTKFQVGDYIPLDNIDSFSISFSGNSYTNDVYCRDLTNTKALIEKDKKKFTILMHRNASITKYLVYELLPPFIIHNCLPKAFQLQFVAKAKTKHTKTILSQYTHQVCASETIEELEFRLNVDGYGWSKLFGYNDNEGGRKHNLTHRDKEESPEKFESTIVLEDEDGAQTHLSFTFTKNDSYNQYVLTIYSKAIVLNQLKDKLVVYGNLAEQEKEEKNDTYRLLGGQKKNNKDFDDKLILIGSEVGNKIRICGANSVFDFATPIPIGGIGQSSSRIIVDREFEGKMESVFTIIGVEISLMKMSPHCDVFSKKIILKSKGIISNTTKHDFILRQQFAKKFYSELPAGIRVHSTFGMPELNHQRNNGFTIEAKGFKKSKIFFLPEEGYVFFKLKRQEAKSNDDAAFIKLNVQKVQGYNFYELIQVQEEQLPYEVIVKSKYLKVSVGQARNRTIKQGQSVKFLNQAEQNQTFEPTICVSHVEGPGFIWTAVKPDDLNYKSNFKLQYIKQGRTCVHPFSIYVKFSDKTKTIVVDEPEQNVEERQIEKSYMLMNLPEIIISVSQNSHGISRPYESIVLTLRRIIFIKDETDRLTKYQLKLGFMQIDQMYPYTTSNPVIITPYKFEEFTREQNPEAIFNSMMVINNSFVDNTFIDQISVDFNDIVVKFSLEFLNLVTEISKQYADIMNYQEKEYFLNNETEKWQNIEIPKEGRKTFIKSINISPIHIDLSAELNLKKIGGLNFQLLNTLISAIGVVFSNIEDAPIKLSGMSIKNCIDTSDGITQKIISQYKGDVINQFYKIFGSLNIIGNPMGLLRNISTGFQDLTTKPAKGFVQGPAEFGKGIVQGTGSLVAHSVGGAFNSLSKITGTVSTGLANLAFDDEFEEHRQKQKMKKPKNIIQGLQKGGKAVAYGFKEGLTGVFLQPYENAKKEGVLGFFKGAGKGMAGLVVKPVTGLIDFASKTTEGIKNNALMFEDKANESRMRYPRVFYTECHILKIYDNFDAMIQYSMMKADSDEKYEESIFIQAFPTGDGRQFLAVMHDQVVMVDMEKRKVRWHWSLDQFEIRNIAEKRLLHLRRTVKTSIFHHDQREVAVNDDQEREVLMKLIQRIIKERLDNK